MSEILSLVSGYDRKKVKEVKQYRVLEVEDVKRIPSYGHTTFLSVTGIVRNAKVTSVKTWKTRPNDITVNLKYGIYEYASTSWVNGIHISGVKLLEEVVQEEEVKK